jgi:hypothetical protein
MSQMSHEVVDLLHHGRLARTMGAYLVKTRTAKLLNQLLPVLCLVHVVLLLGLSLHK